MGKEVLSGSPPLAPAWPAAGLFPATRPIFPYLDVSPKTFLEKSAKPAKMYDTIRTNRGYASP